MSNLIEMPDDYVGRDLGHIEMPDDSMSLLVNAAQNAVGRAPGDELTGQVAATLQALGMSPGPVVPDPQMGVQLAEMAQPALTPSYAAVPTYAPGEAQLRPDFPRGVDRIGADTAAPVQETLGFPQQPPEYAPPPTTSAGMQGQVDAASARQDEAYLRAQDAQFRAQQFRLAAVASASERAVDAQLALNNSYQAERKLIEAKVDADVAAGLQELTDLAKKEPNPGRWWDNQSGLGKALWGMALIFGAAHTAITPGAQNAALAMVRQEIADDVERQRSRLGQEMAVGKMRLSVIQAKGERNLTDHRDDWQREYTRLQALERAWIARATVPGDQDAAAAKQMGLAQIEQWKTQRLEQRRLELRQSEEAAAARRFQAGQAALARQHAADQARLQREWQTKEKELDRALQLALAPVSVGMTAGPTTGGSKRNPVGKDGQPMYRELQSGPGQNAVLLDKDGRPANGDGIMLFRDDKQLGEAAGKMSTANEQYTALVELRNSLAAEGSMWEAAALGTISPSLNATINKVGYAIAQSQNKQVTDKDYSSGVSQALGFDPDGKWLGRVKFAANLSDIKALVDTQLANLPEHVSNKLSNDYNDGAINGQNTRLAWKPDLLVSPEVPQRSQNQLEGKPSVTYDEKPVRSPAEYEKRSAIERADPMRRGQELPDHFEDKVAAVISLTKDPKTGKAGILSPESVRAEVNRVLADLDKEATKPGADANRIEQTRKIVTTMGNGAILKAKETLEKFENYAVTLPFTASEETLHKMAIQKYGLRAPREVDEVIKRVRGGKSKYQSLPLGGALKVDE